MSLCLNHTDNIKLKKCGPLFLFNHVAVSGEILSARKERNKKEGERGCCLTSAAAFLPLGSSLFIRNVPTYAD